MGMVVYLHGVMCLFCFLRLPLSLLSRIRGRDDRVPVGRSFRRLGKTTGETDQERQGSLSIIFHFPCRILLPRILAHY